MPAILNALYVEGLKSNLLGISQICEMIMRLFLFRKCVLHMTQMVMWSWKEEEPLITIIELFQILIMYVIVTRLI